RVYDKPEFVTASGFDPFLMFLSCGPLQFFTNFGSLTKFLRRFGHHDWNRIGGRPGRTSRDTSGAQSAESAARKRISSVLSNTSIAELLAHQAETETGIRSRAFRRYARSAFTWPEEGLHLVAQNRSLTELRGIGPFIETQIRQWIDKPPRAKTVPAVRRDFLSLAEARRVLAARPGWQNKLRGDLQMHTRWSDGSGTVAEMAGAAANPSFEYIAIT